jgi:hypothetical protein
MIASCARLNASSTFPVAFAARPDVASVPAAGTVSTSISISPTLTGISRLAATAPIPRPLRDGSAARHAIHLKHDHSPANPRRHHIATTHYKPEGHGRRAPATRVGNGGRRTTSVGC